MVIICGKMSTDCNLEWVKYRGDLIKYSRIYCSFWSSVASAGNTVGIPGMNVLSASSFVQRDFLFLFFSGGGQLADSVKKNKL